MIHGLSVPNQRRSSCRILHPELVVGVLSRWGGPKGLLSEIDLVLQLTCLKGSIYKSLPFSILWRIFKFIGSDPFQHCFDQPAVPQILNDYYFPIFSKSFFFKNFAFL
jgi:hypothetical protein